MVRVDASRRVTSSAETEEAFSFADAFFVGAMGVCLVFALVAMSKFLEEFKDKQRRGATRVKHRSRDRTLTRQQVKLPNRYYKTLNIMFLLLSKCHLIKVL